MYELNQNIDVLLGCRNEVYKLNEKEYDPFNTNFANSSANKDIE